jgi:beta-lactamase regulating signal transducer with metallopeptidase domain
MTVSELQILAQVVTERVLNTALEGIVLVGMVWLLLRLISRQNSGTRFAIWLSALLAVVALPFLSGRGFGASSPAVLPPANLAAEINLSSSWANYLFALWGIGAGLSLLRLSVGLWRVRQIRGRCCEVDLATLDPATAGLLRTFRSRRQVKLCVSSEVAAPAAIGFFQPAVVFPAGLLSQLSAEEMKVILLHELAHLRRWDDWTNLGQKIVKALFFFHPAVWWIENRLTLEREMACDDIVLAQTGSPRAYASSLISFAEKLRYVRGLALAQSLVSRVCQMSLRVAHILDARRPSRNGLWRPVAGVSAGLLALVLGAAPYTPRIVAFQSQSSLRQTREIPAQQVAKQVAKNDAPVGVVGAARSRTVMANVVQPPRAAPQPTAIAASFNPRSAVVPLQLKTSPRKPLLMRARAVREERPMQYLPLEDTFVILQTTRFDASGSGVWTLCVWIVRGENRAEWQGESAIVLSLI